MAPVVAAIAEYASFIFGSGAAGAFVYAAADVIIYAAEIYLLNSAVSSLSRKKPGEANEGRGLDVSITDTGQGGFAIYGKVRVGGVNCIPPVTGGSDGRYLEQVLAFALHEVDSFIDVYADDTQITFANISAVAGNSNDGLIGGSSKYAGKMWVRRYAGTSTQTVDFILNNRYSSAFTSAFRGRGIPYAAITYDWGDGKTYQGIPVMTFEIKGKKCYDPRLDSSPGNDPTNILYIAWTENPALCWADYAMADYGGSVTAASINWASVVAAANICDALVNIPGSTTQKRYTFNGRLYIPTDPDWRDNAKSFVDAMMGRVVFRDGKWFIYAGAWDVPSYTVNKLDWLAIDRVKTVAPRDGGRWNTARCWYVDPTRNWQREECFPRRNATYKSADGNEEIALEMEQPACTNEYEAQRKAELLLRQSRNQIAITGRLPPRFRKMATGDTAALNFEEFGWSSKGFRIRSMSLNSDSSVDVALIEEQTGDWDDLLAADYNQPSSSTIPTPNPTTPSAPAAFTIDILSVAGTLQFTIGSPVVVPLGTRYQIIRGDVSTNAAAGTVVYDGADLKTNLAAPYSAGYYWSRAYVGSFFGPYLPNTTGTLIGPLIWGLGQNTSSNSYGTSDQEVVNHQRFLPQVKGRLDITATVEGKASFNGDSGTSFKLCCGPTANVSSGLGIVQFNTSSFDGGARGQFTTNSIYQMVTLNAQFDVSSGIDYTLGLHCYSAFPELTVRNVNLTHNFTPT